MRLIDDIREDWRVATRWASVQLSGLGVVLTGAWAVMPQDLRDKLPHAELIATVLFVLVILGRVTKQGTGNGRTGNGA